MPRHPVRAICPRGHVEFPDNSNTPFRERSCAVRRWPSLALSKRPVCPPFEDGEPFPDNVKGQTFSALNIIAGFPLLIVLVLDPQGGIEPLSV